MKINNNLMRARVLFFILTCLTGIWALFPFHDFQYYLATGDHGRDLYAAQQVLKGALPYRDFSWLFGPLMPYYYAGFLKTFGLSIQSVLLGQNILILLAGLLVYLACSVFLSPAMSFACALWYWAFRGIEFFYTYNHIGGLVMILATVWVTLQYLHRPHIAWIYAGSFLNCLLILIRPNMGLAIFTAYVLNIILIDLTQKHKCFLIRSPLRVLLPSSILALCASIYGYLLFPLEGYEIYQSFPYGRFQRTDTVSSVTEALLLLKKIFLLSFTQTPLRILLGIALLVSVSQILLLFFRRKIPNSLQKHIPLIITILSVFILFGLHEFIGSGVAYRLNWIFACFLILIFHIIFWMIRLGPPALFTPLVQFFLMLLFLTPAVVQIKKEHRHVSFLRTVGSSLQIGKTSIHTSQPKQWTHTVQSTVKFIQDHVPQKEKILAIPFDPLYYFLSQRDGASRQLVFFDHIHIPHQQEHKIIQELQRHNTRWIVLSNRIYSIENGMGIFGKTYGILIARYLDKHFEPVASFGDWNHPGGWTTPHGTRILRRKP